MSINMPLQDIKESDLQALVNDKVPEGKTIEYKESLPSNSYQGKKEFLADVSSFANTIGGDLIFGVREKDGVPTKICGLENINLDTEKSRMDHLIQNCIEPRIIQNISMNPISLQNSKIVLVLRISKSWAGPHVVKIEGHWKFYARNSSGKYPIDVQELRSAFLLSETTIERIQNFRLERIAAISANETSVPLENNPKIVLHIIPISAFSYNINYNILLLYSHRHELMPVWSDSLSSRYNFDGFLAYPYISSESNCTDAYSQFYRNGIVEIVDASIIRVWSNDKIIPSFFEEKIIKGLRNSLKYLKFLEVNPPFIVMLSFLGVRGHVVALSGRPDLRRNKIDRDNLLLPDIILESYEVNLIDAMKDIFNMVWNASGFPRSMNFDEAGNWKLDD